ncbi:hypothetical protein, partial [Corallococcus soli]|uniref:hypothetical protein n=1 Tax=Corallococcus soli TaxID=2710757 RepID=UPI0039F008A8
MSLFPEHEEGEPALATIPDVGPSRDARGNKSVPGMPQRSTREMFTIRSASAEKPEAKDWKMPPASSGTFPAIRLPSDEARLKGEGGSPSEAGRESLRRTDPDPFESESEDTVEDGAKAFAIFTEPEFPEGRVEAPQAPAFTEPAPGVETPEPAAGLDATALAGFTPASVEAFDPNGVLGEAHVPAGAREGDSERADVGGADAPDMRSVADAAEASAQDTPAFAETSSAGEEPVRSEAPPVASADAAEQPLDFDVDLHMEADEGSTPVERAAATDSASGFDGREETPEPESTPAAALTTPGPLRSREQDATPHPLETERLLAWGIDPTSLQHEASALPEEVDPFSAALEQAVATSEPAEQPAPEDASAPRLEVSAPGTAGSEDVNAADAVVGNTATADAPVPPIATPFEARAEEPLSEWEAATEAPSESPADEASTAWPDEAVHTSTEAIASVETSEGATGAQDAWTSLIEASASLESPPETADVRRLSSGFPLEPDQADAFREEEGPSTPAMEHAGEFAPGAPQPGTEELPPEEAPSFVEASDAVEFHSEEAPSQAGAPAMGTLHPGEASLSKGTPLHEADPSSEALSLEAASVRATASQVDGLPAEAPSSESAAMHAAPEVEGAATQDVSPHVPASAPPPDVVRPESPRNEEASHTSLANPDADVFETATPVDEDWAEEEPTVFTVDSESTSAPGAVEQDSRTFDAAVADDIESTSAEGTALPSSTTRTGSEDPLATGFAKLDADRVADAEATALSPESAPGAVISHEGASASVAPLSFEVAPATSAVEAAPASITEATSSAATHSALVPGPTETSSTKAASATDTDASATAPLVEAAAITRTVQPDAALPARADSAVDTDPSTTAILAETESITRTDQPDAALLARTASATHEGPSDAATLSETASETREDPTGAATPAKTASASHESPAGAAVLPETASETREGPTGATAPPNTTASAFHGDPSEAAVLPETTSASRTALSGEAPLAETSTTTGVPVRLDEQPGLAPQQAAAPDLLRSTVIAADSAPPAAAPVVEASPAAETAPSPVTPTPHAAEAPSSLTTTASATASTEAAGSQAAQPPSASPSTPAQPSSATPSGAHTEPGPLPSATQGAALEVPPIAASPSALTGAISAPLASPTSSTAASSTDEAASHPGSDERRPTAPRAPDE